MSDANAQSGCCGTSCCEPVQQEQCCEPTQDSSCCGGDNITEAVRAGYAKVSVDADSRTDEQAKAAYELAKGMGYTDAELADVPEEANMGLQCGNCIVLAKPQPGETVVDLGSGGGFDIFIAAKRVGETGKCIGVDMTEEMIAKATATAKRRGITNTEFRLGNIASMPIEDNSVDVIISNCVINLTPDKNAVFRDMFRILKPGGRVAVSDVLLTDKMMPSEARNSLNLLVGCVAGAVPASEYLGGMSEAGFAGVEIANGGQNLNNMWRPNKDDPSAACCCAVDVGDIDDESLKNMDLNDYVFSGKIIATKPKASE